MKIIPAIIPKTFDDLNDKLSSVNSLVPLVQIDVLDGSLAQGIRAWPYQSASKSDDNFDSIIQEKQGFPFWESLEFDAHLMVRDPERIISDWISAGASKIIVQIEGTENFEKCIEIVDKSIPLGISIALDTPDEIISKFANDIQIIQCMGWKLSSLGKQGQNLDKAIFARIKKLRELYPKAIINVDGGINLENAPSLRDVGADNLVVGSAIWKNGMVRDNLEDFKKALN